MTTVTPSILLRLPLDPLRLDGIFYCCHEAANIEASGVQHDRLLTGQLFQARRQLVGAWQLGLVNQNRDNQDSAFEGSLDLQSHPVLRVIYSPSAVTFRGQPSRPYHDKQNGAGHSSRHDLGGEVISWPDRVHVLKYNASTEPVGQFISQPAHGPTSVFPSVTNKYLGRLSGQFDFAPLGRFVINWLKFVSIT
jgi:hypothetical protein